MTLSGKQLKLITNGITDIHVNLEWDHGRGLIDKQDNADCRGFSVYFNVLIHGDCVKMGSPGFMEEQVYSEPTFTTDILDIMVYDSGGDKLEMTQKQYKSIQHNLLQNIYPS